MDRILNRSRTKTSNSGEVIVFEPVKLRTGGVWRALAFAKAALLVWGGVSLAGVAAGAILYAQGAFPLLPRPPAPKDTVLAAVAAPESRTAPKPVRAEVRVVPEPSPPAAKIIDVKAAIPAPASALPARLAPPAEPAAAPIVEARVPQARPDERLTDEPLTTGSIKSQADAETPPRRFRRLRDMQLRYPYAPGAPLRMQPPLRETDAAGRHIRQIWSSFSPQRRAPQESWRDGQLQPR